MSLVQTIEPASEPVSVAEAKVQCNVYFDSDDDFLSALIGVARERCEEATWRQLCHATWVLRMRAFPPSEWIELPRPPLVSVASVSYVDGSGATQTLSTDVYSVDPYSQPGRIVLKYGQSWPVTRDQEDAVTITFTAGYSADGTSVPKRAKQSILMRVAHWYEFREPTVEATVSQVVDGPEQLDRLLAFRKCLNIVGLGVAEL